MGYSTTFKGVLKFKNELTTSALGKLTDFLGADCREHPEWGHRNLTYIDLELTKDFKGLQWDGSEKTYDLKQKVQIIIDQMRKDYPEFDLEGSLLAQGEKPDDRWELQVFNGESVKKEIPLSSDEIICPHCSGLFRISEAKKK